MKRRRKLMTYSLAGLLILLSLLYLFPYVWMVSMSLKPDAEIYSLNVIPENPTLEQYQRLFFGYQFNDITLKITLGIFQNT
jgi:multiple sugar transport system permease protein